MTESLAEERNMRRRTSALVSLVTLSICSLAAQAGVVPISRLSEIHVTGMVNITTLSDDAFGNEFGIFNGPAGNFHGVEPDTRASGSGDQNSNIDLTSQPGRLLGAGEFTSTAFAAFGEGDTAGPLNINVENQLTVDFQITDVNEQFRWSGLFDPDNQSDAGISVSLTETSTPPLGQAPFSAIRTNALADGFIDSFSLRPGTYRLFVD